MGSSRLVQQFEQAFIIGDRWKLYLRGLGVSFELTLGALAIGIVLGVIVAVIRTMHDQQRKGHKNPVIGVLNFICEIYTTVIRGTPMMVQIMIMYFVIFVNTRNTILVSILSFGINSGAYVSEIFRSGIMSVDPGQMEAGRSLGLPYGTVMKDIIIPQAVKNVLPALGNELITLFKDTSLASVIGLVELTKVAANITALTYQALMPYLGIALMYLVCVMIMTWLLGIFERRLRRSDRR